jgi:Spy/CpxP family protein refolding chaperone
LQIRCNNERRNIMKRRIIFGALLAVTAGSVSAAWAAPESDCRSGGSAVQEGKRSTDKVPRHGKREHEEQGFARIKKALGLSDAQQAKFEGILQAERDKSAPLQQKLEVNRKWFRQMELAAKFYETEVRTIATSQAQLIAEMIVARVRAQNQIHSLLTPKQRAIAEKLRPPMPDCGQGPFTPLMYGHGPGHFRPPPGGVLPHSEWE